ncbi:hypothetical protein BT69DRAFT_866121 [Atractiella rhizophila]|nr:hypothetical protein BT69DRAFT_866121 [Atractiella rhizophila]
MDCIRILRNIVGSSPDVALEHDFPAPPEKKSPKPPIASPYQRTRHVSFDSIPQILPIGGPSVKIPVPPTPSTPLKSPPSQAVSPLSPRMPLREGSGIFICLRYQNAMGIHETFEPFGHRWGWSDPVVVTEASGVHDFVIQTGSLLRVLRPHRNWNSALDHAKSLGLIDKSKLLFLPGKLNAEVLVLALFRIRGINWAAGVEGGRPGLIPLECLGPETSRASAGQAKIVSKPLHEHARSFLASRVVGKGGTVGRPVKGVVGPRFLSYFDSEIEDPIGFFHHLNELKIRKGMKDQISVEGVGVFYNVPTVIFIESGVIHELLFEDVQRQTGFYDDIRRMQLRGKWV